MGYVYMSDLGQGGLAGLAGREATDEEKHRASVMADNGDKAGVIALVGPLNAWESSWKPVAAGGWYSNTDVILRASTTWAERNPGAVTALEFGRRMSDPIQATKTAGGYYEKQAKDAVPCLSNPISCVPWWAWAAGGTVVVGVGLFYFGGFIKAAGNLADRSTGR